MSVCYQWSDTGYCKYGDRCRFLHNQNNSQIAQYQRRQPEYHYQQKYKSNNANLSYLDVSLILKLFNNYSLHNITPTVTRLMFYSRKQDNIITSKSDEIIKPHLLCSNFEDYKGFDMNTIKIDFPEVLNKTNGSNYNPCSLNEYIPNNINLNRYDTLAESNFNICQSLKNIKFNLVTMRHNIREIAKAVIGYKGDLIKFAVFKKNGIIRLENIQSHTDLWLHEKHQMIYGHLFEYLLTSNHSYVDGPNQTFEYSNEHNEIRLLSHIKMNDISILSAAEMDACICNQDAAFNIDNIELVEIKTTSHNGLFEKKLLSIWSQCFFGGVDSFIVGYHKDGKIKRIVKRAIKDAVNSNNIRYKIKQCNNLIYKVLKWICGYMQTVEDYKMYSVIYNNSYQRFEIKPLGQGTKKMDFQDLMKICGSTHGLCIHSKTKEISIKRIYNCLSFENKKTVLLIWMKKYNLQLDGDVLQLIFNFCFNI